MYIWEKLRVMTDVSLYTKINSLPEHLKAEVNDFIDFLISKKESGNRRKNRKAGFLKGKIEMSPDFDEPLDDFKEYM
jgi:hypothetical protein